MLKFKGSLKISGDKSISHRSLIIASMSCGITKITNLLESEDVFSTMNILKALGIKIKKEKNKWEVYGNGTCGYMEPHKTLDCGNSGTTARLMLGAVAANPINCTFIGDKSLSRRSMSRVTDYLKAMGNDINLTRKDFLPIMISGNDNLIATEHEMLKASAQVKSAIMLAGLNIHGKTVITENKPTRDHTERLFKYFDINFKIKKIKNGGSRIELIGPYEIKSKNIDVACDPSSAAFFVVGALITPLSNITLKDICLNPTRIAYLKILKKMGGNIKINKTKNICGEDIGDITVEYSKLHGIKIDSHISPLLIDEYPILAIAACQAKGKTIMNGLSELRHKESDRVKSIVSNLKKLGYDITVKQDNIIIKGKENIKLKKQKIRSFNDHRIAMSFSILNIIFEDQLIIDDEKCINISYPKFKDHLNKLLSK